MKRLDMFIEDCKYYDKENLELKAILRYAKIKGKTVLDIGAGIGRLSFPLSKYSGDVVALDKDKIFLPYFKKYKRKNLKFINKEAECFLKKKRKFDIILLAWPTINFKIINLIKKAMGEKSIFIFITCDNDSDYEIIIDKLDSGIDFKKDIKNKKKFLDKLPKKFKLTRKQEINTKYTYPNEKIALRVLKNSMKLWFNTEFNKERENKLKTIIKEHKTNGKIIFKEKVWLYLLK